MTMRCNMDMRKTEEFYICKDYKRVQLDFDEIQRNPNNPKDEDGYPKYPEILSHKVGSSYTYKVSDDYFFKRNQQDGNGQAQDTIISLHHYNKNYHALYGSLDDIAETACYILSKNMINPKTGKPLVKVAEYALATYVDKEGVTERGCITKNVCEDKNSTLISMAEMLRLTTFAGNSINVYMDALDKYCKRFKISYDPESIRRELIKNSYFCWKVANSDNHKNNITFILKTLPDGKAEIEVSPLIDNGSAYELSSPYYLSRTNQPRFQAILESDEFSKLDENGERVFNFIHYPQRHNAFHLDKASLTLNETSMDDKSYVYEYCLASEMLEDPELFFEIFQIEKQLDLDKMEEEFNSTYGSPAFDHAINWPPLLREYMHETNACKSRNLAYVVADYYFHNVFSNCIEKVDRNNPSQLYDAFRNQMLSLPLLQNKEAYDDVFVKIAESLGLTIDENKLKNVKHKKPADQMVNEKI